MRVITGKYKNKKLKFPTENKNLRPTADIVKEALFMSLFNMEEIVFLDLFCGCGGIGIEALSRGAKHVDFVDNSSFSLSFTKENLKDVEKKYSVYKMAYDKFLLFTKRQYDIIFIDPPYCQAEYYEIALKMIKQKNLLCRNGKIVLEHNENFICNNNYFEIISKKRYGKKFLTYLA